MTSEGRWPPLDPPSRSHRSPAGPAAGRTGRAAPPAGVAGGALRARWEERHPAEPTPPPGPEPDDARPTRRLLVATALVLIGLGAAVLVQSALGVGSPGGRAGDGWSVEELGNSRRLARDGERVCSTTAEQLLFCVDGRSGETLFTRQMDESVVTSPALAEGRVLVAGTDEGSPGTLYALSLDGAELWRARIDAPGDRPIAVVDGVVVVASGDFVSGELVGLDAESGTELWRTYSGSGDGGDRVVSSSAFTDGDRVYASVVPVDPDPAAGPSGPSGRVVAVDPRTGEELWRTPELASISSARGLAAVVPVDEGTAVAALLPGLPAEEARTPGQVAVLDVATGEVLWDVAVSDRSPGIAHATGLTVVVDGPRMRAYGAEGGEVWAAAVPGHDGSPETAGPSALLPAGGRLVVAGRDVHAVDLGSGASHLVAESGITSDVTVAGGHLVVAGALALSGVPIDDVVTPR